MMKQEVISYLVVSCVVHSAAYQVYHRNMNYLGCFRDSSERDLWAVGKVTSSTNKPSECYYFCRSGGYHIAGMQNGNECYCDQEYGIYGEIAEGFCSSSCAGDKTEKCGGNYANSVYGISPDETVTDRKELRGHLGCYGDTYSDRDLNGYYRDFSSLTIQTCIDTCKSRGYRYAGVQYRTQCYCGNSYGKHGTLLINKCNKKCAGDNDEYCGGSNANNVYDVNYQDPSYRVCHGGDLSTIQCTGDSITADMHASTCGGLDFCFFTESTNSDTFKGYCCDYSLGYYFRSLE